MLLVKTFISFLLLMLPNRRGLLNAGGTCYWTNTSYDEKCDENKQFEVHFINGNAKGDLIAEVELPPRSCGYFSFDIHLDKKEKLPDDTNCAINGVGYFHSWKKFRRVKCETDNCPNICGKFANITFHNVNTGQYYIRVSGSTSRQNIWKDFSFPISNFTTNFNSSWATEIKNVKTPCIERKTINFNLAFTPPTSEVNIYLADQNGKEVKYILLNSSNSEKITGISCALKNKTEIKYEMEVEFSNERNCDDETKKQSKQYSEYECLCWKTEKYTIYAEEEHKKKDDLLLICILALIFSLLALSLVLLILWRKKQTTFGRNGTISDETIDIPLLTNEILLLYPRDCPQFMELMKSLKIILETSYHMKVYDFYDTHYEEILYGPEEWCQSLMRQTGLRIIIVTTQCAYIQQGAFLSHAKCQYQQPDFLDHLFLYCLTHIKRKFCQDVYHKIYVVQISGFSDDVALKFLPTDLTRYKLPDHFDKMFIAMNIISPEGVSTEVDNLLKRDSYKGFIKSLEELKMFKKMNENYLYQMLKVYAE